MNNELTWALARKQKYLIFWPNQNKKAVRKLPVICILSENRYILIYFLKVFSLVLSDQRRRWRVTVLGPK